MAKRPVFFSTEEGKNLVEVKMVDFKWFAGMAASQKQKCIDSLHQEVQETYDGIEVLEVSSKSRLELGQSLSAFNLGFTQVKSGNFISIESAFQGSKVFENGGPFTELYLKSSLEAKQFFRDKELGVLTCFNFYGQPWELEPHTLFYDWIYINALYRDIPLANKVMDYDSFTDIEFNPKKSFNCQARSVALFVALRRTKQLAEIIGDPFLYRKLMLSDLDKFPSQYKIPVQQSLI